MLLASIVSSPVLLASIVSRVPTSLCRVSPVLLASIVSSPVLLVSIVSCVLTSLRRVSPVLLASIVSRVPASLWRVMCDHAGHMSIPRLVDSAHYVACHCFLHSAVVMVRCWSALSVVRLVFKTETLE